MNKKGKIGKIIFWTIFVIGLIVVINKFSNIVNPENIKINYVIPLPTGAIITEIDYSTLQTIELKYKEFTSKLPLMEYEITEGNPFLIEFSIISPEKYENISLKVEHSNLLENIQISDKARTPLPRMEGNIFKFQEDLYPEDTTTLILTGNAVNLNDIPYSGANIKIIVFSYGQEVFRSKDKTIKICKENVESGCSNKIKQITDLFKDVFTTNTSTQTE